LKNDVFALRNNELIHIEKAIRGESGYCCCKCKEELIVRDGEKNIKHFSHKQDSNCKGGLETSIHLFAKKILEMNKKIRLPNIDINRLNQGDWYEFDEVKCEEFFEDIKPDITTYKNGQKLFIEIAVTHRIEESKKSKIREKIKIPTIEIYLENVVNDEEKLTDRIINSLDRKEWIYYDNYKFNEEINDLKKEISRLENEKLNLQSEKEKLIRDNDNLREEWNKEKIELRKRKEDYEVKLRMTESSKIDFEYVGHGSTSSKERNARYTYLWLDKIKLIVLPTNDRGQISLKMWEKKEQEKYSGIVKYNVAIDKDVYPDNR
jgi:hypothetical protein